MAGDWIKVRTNLWDDPRVSRLCDLTGSTEAAVIGALYWLWSAADQHTEDGIMRGLTTGAIDRKTGVKGIGDALCDIGWLADHPEGVRIIHFDEHNGTSAKSRMEVARRVAKHRLKESSQGEQNISAEREAVPRKLRMEVIERDGNACVYCGRMGGVLSQTDVKADGYMHIDHVIPVAQGGSNDISNLVCSCRRCNLEKGDRTPDEAGMQWPVINGDRAGNKKPLPKQHETVTSPLPREEKRREDTNKPPLPPKGEFERFWKAYPRKVGKDAAQRAFDKRRPTAALVDDMVAAIERQCRSDAWTKDGGQFIPHPTTWLDQGRWNDEAPVIHIPTPLDRGPDPELERIKRDAAQATPMPSFVKELAAQLTGKAH